MEKKIKIELRVTTSGAVLSWEVYLENTNSSSKVRNWIYESKSETNYFFKVLENYSINDDELDVYVGCEGKVGGSTTCEVIIDNKPQQKKVECKNTDKDYAHGEFNI